MIKKSFAKINFAINVKEKRADNYHELDMIMSKIALFDKIYMSTLKEDKILLTCTNRFIPCDERNLVYQVAVLMKEKFNIKEGLKIHITKYIPMQAGLGGGSSNAATTLDMIDEMFNLNLTLEDKIALSKDLGSDIPFFFYNQIARVQGKGDEITPISGSLKDTYLLLVKPRLGASTKKVYANLDLATCDHPDIDTLVKAFKDEDYNAIISNLGNSLQNSAMQICPSILALKEELDTLGIDVSLLCGSGSTIFALTKSEAVMKRVKNAHTNKKNFVYATRFF